MSLQFPAPAASEQPGTPAHQPFPVYDPVGKVRDPDPDGNHTPQRPSEQGPVLQAPQAGPLGEFQKVEESNPTEKRGELLFTIAGKPLYAPHEDNIDPAIGFRLIRDMRRYGVQVAAMNAFGDLLGEEALDLLCDAPRMTKEEWGQIMDVLRDKVFAKMTDSLPGGKG